VAVDALPTRSAVIVFAAKFCDASRATTFPAVEVVVASTAHVVAAEPSKFEPVRYVPRVRVLFVFAVTTIFAEPLNDTPLIVRAVCKVVAVEALPVNVAVIVFAAKLPETSLATTLLAVAASVASTSQVVAADPLKFEPVR
jgi:hypothetical protein